MSALRFTNQHEWITVDGDVATVGITDFAQQQLGDIVHVELPAVGKPLRQGEEAAVVESVKVASEVYAPVSGEVTAVNDDLASSPELVNQDPLGGGWFVKLRISDPSELQDLMTEERYQEFVAKLA